jgi:hypothetical protein
MNFIRKIKEAINDNRETFKVAFFPSEMAVYVWEEEIPISVFLDRADFNNVVLDVEGYAWQLTTYKVQKLGEIMEILFESMDEIREVMKDV